MELPGPPSGYPAPPPAAAPTPGRRTRWVLLAGVLAVLFAVSAGVGLLLSGGDDAEDPAGEDDQADDGVTDAEVEALVDELSVFVEDQRELEFLDEVKVEVLDADAYRDRVVADAEDELAESVEDLRTTAGAFDALGLWKSDADPVEVARRFVALASVGSYDPETDELLVLGSGDTPNLRVTLVHELTHALDDQHFDLDRLEELDERTDESASAYSALVEGNASRVDSAYAATLTDDERDEIDAEQLALLDGVDLTGIPPVLFATQQVRYDSGEAFVDQLLEDGGNAAIDDALREPPTTTEQILEPETWPERDPVVDVEVPEADGEIVETGVVGQAFLGILVNGVFGEGDVPEWDGDNSVIWTEGERYCVRFAVAGDAEGYEEALGSWADSVDAEMAVVDDLLVATSCS